MEENKRIGEHIVDHLTDGLEGKVSDPTLAEWLAEDVSNQKALACYRRIWEESSSYLRREAVDVESAWKKVDAINQRNERKRIRLARVGYVVSGIAATLLVVLGLSIMGMFDRKPELLVRMSTGYGSRSEVVLPDGSVVKLNSGSDLVYVYDADRKIREVRFQGEGFFDVAKDKDVPFVICMADSLRLRVHGTSFNLKAYADEETVETSLVEGCIELDSEDERLVMTAGDMAVFDRRAKRIKPVDYLERRYDVNIRVQEGLGESIHYDGVIQEDNVTDVLDVLSRLSDIDYTMKGKDICITSK